MANKLTTTVPSGEPCVFCRIIKGEIGAMKVYEDAYLIGILDINPVNPGHLLVMPKQHYETLTDMPANLAGHIINVVSSLMLAEKRELDPSGFNVINNNGLQAGQVVPHFHMHLIPRYEGDEKSFDFLWLTKKLDNEQMKKIQSGIIDKLKSVKI